MHKFLKMIQLATIVGTTSVGALWQENALTISIQRNNFQNWRVEKISGLSSSAEDMTVFNNELYIAMSLGKLAKIDKQGNITYLIEQGKKINVITKFNDYLYFSSKTERLAKVDKQGNVTHLTKSLNHNILKMTSFNGYLYIALESGRIYKMDKNENITFVDLSINYTSYINLMVVYNNHLYFLKTNGQFFKIDKYENITHVLKIRHEITAMQVFNDELYLGGNENSSYGGNLFKINKQDRAINLNKTEWMISSLAVFNNELYVGTMDPHLWKIDKQGKLSQVITVADLFIFKMQTFNNELYIFHDMSSYSKLTNK